MKTIILTTLAIILLSACGINSQKNVIKKDGNEYRIGEIPNLDNFNKYIPMEVEIDSSFSKFDKLGMDIPKDFRNNRARIFSELYHNENQQPAEKEYADGFPMPCKCFLHNDTLTVQMGIGFFGGMGFLIDLCGNNYTSSFFVYTDDAEPYKSDISDTVFHDYAITKYMRQDLILDQRPEFRTGQLLTGFLDFESKPYYTDAGSGMLDSSRVASKIYFTCRTRLKTIFD